MKYLGGALLLFAVVSCGDVTEVGIGETCGGFTTIEDAVVCEAALFCCQPNPAIADAPGTCVASGDLGASGDPCGPASRVCCADGSACVDVDAAGVGTCP